MGAAAVGVSYLGLVASISSPEGWTRIYIGDHCAWSQAALLDAELSAGPILVLGAGAGELSTRGCRLSMQHLSEARPWLRLVPNSAACQAMRRQAAQDIDDLADEIESRDEVEKMGFPIYVFEDGVELGWSEANQQRVKGSI